MLKEPLRSQRLRAIARPDGGMTILANDQRESLRTLLARAGRPTDDTDLSDFKVAVARALSPSASAMLIDPLYGLGPIRDTGSLAPSCGLIVAADQLIQQPGQAVADTAYDRSLAADPLVCQDAQALKLLVLWVDDGERTRREAMVIDFIDRCSELGVLSVVEGIVRPPAAGMPDWDHAEAVVGAARELGALGPDLYKAEVPTLGLGSDSTITATCEEISRSLSCPWVVLSGGVRAERFPATVVAACKAGASGFLAGRGIWGPSIDAPDPESALATDAVSRMAQLVDIVDDTARPWDDA